ncbi:hypothetical protein ABEO83_18380 [Bacillus glycinifermentans]|uniref:hypothetical protein n=1 Tax=Bacillus glycinifermentans TaxID=1664069 RepID=UPI003D1F6CE8
MASRFFPPACFFCVKKNEAAKRDNIAAIQAFRREWHVPGDKGTAAVPVQKTPAALLQMLSPAP